MTSHERLQEYLERKIPLSSLTCPPLSSRFEGHYHELLAIFERFNIHVTDEDTHTIVSFPEGTYKQAIYPLIRAERHHIFVPGGFYFYQTCTPAGAIVLLIPLQFFPPATQEKYKDYHEHKKDRYDQC